jgi:hypothetical protein
MADAISAERSLSGATVEVGRASLAVALKERLKASPALVQHLLDVQRQHPMDTAVGITPGSKIAHNAGPVFRAAYLIRALERIQGADDPDAQIAAERRHLAQHQGAQIARELGAMRLDAARDAYGRTLGWYAQDDDRVTPECAEADGKNFDTVHPPLIGLPGIGPHHGCRCRPGPPHEGAAFLPSGTPDGALPTTTIRLPAAPRSIVATAGAVDFVSGDTSPFSSSTTSNWVARRGGLPGRVRAIARAVKRKHPEWSLSRCIAVAINAVKYSAATGDSKLPGRQNERPSTVAAHSAAAAHWEAMKGKRGKGGGKRKVNATADPLDGVELAGGHHVTGTPHRYRHGWIPITPAAAEAESTRHAVTYRGRDGKHAMTTVTTAQRDKLRSAGHLVKEHDVSRARGARPGSKKKKPTRHVVTYRDRRGRRAVTTVTTAQRDALKRGGHLVKEHSADTRREEIVLGTYRTHDGREGLGYMVRELSASWDTTEQRRAWAKSGVALPDGSFPIPSVAFLRKAIHAFGRAGDKAKAKAHIIKRARALGATNLLPEGWS